MPSGYLNGAKGDGIVSAGGGECAHLQSPIGDFTLQYPMAPSLCRGILIFSALAGSVSVALGRIVWPNFSAITLGILAGAGLVAAAYYAIWASVGSPWGGFLAAQIIMLGMLGAIAIGMASNDPNWRAGYFFGLLITAGLFFSAVVGYSWGGFVVFSSLLAQFGFDIKWTPKLA